MNKTKQTENKVGIIGAGIGGLSASIYLAAGGFDVEIFEKNKKAGGKVNQKWLGDYRFDMGPSLITLPNVFKDLFEFAGEKIEDYLELQKLDVICKYFWEDGTIFHACSDENQMIKEIEKISTYDALFYSKYLNYCKGIYDYSADYFLYNPFQEKEVLLRFETIKKLFSIKKLDAFKTVNDSVSKYFKSDKLRQIFNRYATYNGSNPFIAPATLNIIPWVEYGLGAFYIDGGIYKLAEVLEKITKSLGTKINYNSRVSKINTRNKKVSSIMVDGEKKMYDFIVANSDATETYKHLLDDESKYQKLEPSISGMVFLWGVKGEHPELNHHNIIFSNNYKEEFDFLFNKLETYDDPTIYISITNKKNKSDAPKGCENWFVLLNMPYIKDQDWEKEKIRMKKAVLNKLKKIGIDIEKKIEEEDIISPLDLYAMYESNKGSIYGTSSNNKFSAFLRPFNRDRKYENLYFAGGSSHPGGGVPLVTLSGKIAAQLIYKKANKRFEKQGIKV